jgi:sulfhydrogenase subunit beta (sulfur reductase)
MAGESAEHTPALMLPRDRFSDLLRVLTDLGYTIVGPTVRDGAIVYDEIRAVEELPQGLTDAQEAGRYRLEKRGDSALFGFAVGPHSWKKYFLPPTLRLWSAHRDGDRVAVDAQDESSAKTALIGVRSCELHAIAIQDKVLIGGPHIDAHYAARRKNLFIVAVNCIVAGGTCFCVSMNTGPKSTQGYDLALTELIGDHHEFLVEIGSESGAGVMARLQCERADDAHLGRAANAIARTEATMGRSMDTTAIKELLYSNLEHPRWDDVAARCLGCANCTMVCPTCFCTTVEDHTDLTGDRVDRVRQWDSCFTMDFSHLHGGSVRTSLKSRYRQWMTHKLASWIDQFGTSGCVGCGRCITWCPVGIDITEEAAAIRATDRRSARTIAESEVANKKE